MSQYSELMILGDWGTSVCRLYLCRFHQQQLTVIARTHGRGIKYINDPEARFFELCQAWFEQYGAMPVFLIGTVGADIGWREAPYVSCPTNKQNMLSTAISFTARDIEFTILPGLSCLNKHNLPDIMRGEETQLFGFLSQQAIDTEEQLICLPGTHTKWALLKQQDIESFVTSPVGELFEILCHHSVLLNPAGNQIWCKHSFTHGLQVGMRETSNLLHTLFATRAHQVIDKHTNTQAAGYLSGLLIGADVKSAMEDYHLFSHVTVIGSDHICSLYVEALKHIGISTEQFSSEDATLLGLQALASVRWKDHADA
jgi:2-dehydro-3-deoxygalactonokinase